MNYNEDNIILHTDSYKLSHWLQYPPETTNVYSYLESRGGKFNYSVFFGLQYFLKRYFEGQVVTSEKIDEAADFAGRHFSNSTNMFNRSGWNYILEKYGGRLPLKIKAVPEGTVLTTKNVLVTVENTDPYCYWLTNYIETLLVQLWYPITVATQSWHMKNIIKDALDETADSADGLLFKLHDFGFRGVSSSETAGIGGMAHLVNFLGTDTINGPVFARNYYNEGMAGFSIPASEHSTITSWGKEHEVNAMRNMLDKYPNGLMACVSDSFNIFDACSKLWGEELRREVIERDGTLVIRPDSGDPLIILPKILNILGHQFGYHTNSKGFKVLHPKVRVIQGDGIDFETLSAIFNAVKLSGWSADNLAFGSGGGLLQKLNRDTMKFAFKCSSVIVNGEEREVFKSPITDKVKVSKKGRLKLINFSGSHGSTSITVGENEYPDNDDQLETVFLNGNVMRTHTFSEIRDRVTHMTSIPRLYNYDWGVK